MKDTNSKINYLIIRNNKLYYNVRCIWFNLTSNSKVRQYDLLKRVWTMRMIA